MGESKKPKTTAEVSLRDTLIDWKEIVYHKNKIDFKFWDESWNEEFED